MKILSFNNPKVKELLRLQKKKLFRYQQNIIVVEGKKEIKMALKKYRPHELFLYKKNCGYLFSIENKFPLVIEIHENVFQKVAYRQENGGIIATFHRDDRSIKELQLPKNPILLVLIGIEKPGNLGAIIRSAEAIGTDFILLSDLKTDIFHSNVIRSSIGTIFIHNVFIYQSNDIIKWLHLKKINILATSIRENSINLFESNFLTGIALIIGNESLGLPFNWINSSDRLLKIPMFGNVDSLNVSTAVAVILFEVLRQRM